MEEVLKKKEKMTPDELVKEWESLGVCAPGDAIGTHEWRCEKFKNCHDCLTDYVSTHECKSIMQVIDYSGGKMGSFSQVVGEKSKN